MTSDLFYIFSGLALLVVGAQFLVRGSSRLAMAIGISPLVVGLTIVALGTSAPELAVSIQSCLAGQTNIVMGNVVGSNIYNVLFILGLCAVITPMVVAPQLIRLDVPIMIGVSILLYYMAWDGRISRVDGVLLLVGIVSYVVFVIRQSRKETKKVQEEYKEDMQEGESADRRWWLHGVYILGGLVLLTFGSDFLVKGAVSIAKGLGVSDLIIGMTVVTLGTTAPELTSSLVASYRGERDIAVGNIVGSNIFNILAVLGVGGLVSPSGITVDPAMLNFAIPVMIAVAISCLPIFFAGHAIRRWEGFVFLAYFGLYMAHLYNEAVNDPQMQVYEGHAYWFVVPLTVIAIGVSVWNESKTKDGKMEMPTPK